MIDVNFQRNASLMAKTPRLICDILSRKVATPATAVVVPMAVSSLLAPPAPQGMGPPSKLGEEQVKFQRTCQRGASFGSTTELVDKNERQKKENLQLKN